MGFVSGFTGGVTVTLGVAYLTLLSHERNRQFQGFYLRSQTQLLNSLVEPTPLPATPSRADIARDSSSTLIETAKVRWNEEIQNAVRWVQHKDWNGVRESMEDTVSRLLGAGTRTTREGVESAEKHAGSIVKAGTDKASTLVKAGANRAYTSGDESLQYAGSKTAEVASATKSRADKALEDTRTGADHISQKVDELVSTGASVAKHAAAGARTNAEHAIAISRDIGDQSAEKSRNATGKVSGAVDLARDAVRDVISKSIDMGKDVVGQAQEAIGVTVKKAESKFHNQSSTISLEDEVLRQRYEKSNEMSKTVEEALAERYTPIDQRNNTVLRGV